MTDAVEKVGSSGVVLPVWNCAGSIICCGDPLPIICPLEPATGAQKSLTLIERYLAPSPAINSEVLMEVLIGLLVVLVILVGGTVYMAFESPQRKRDVLLLLREVRKLPGKMLGLLKAFTWKSLEKAAVVLVGTIVGTIYLIGMVFIYLIEMVFVLVRSAFTWAKKALWRARWRH